MNHRIFNLVYQTPWNILGGAWESIHATLQARHETPVSGGLEEFFTQRQPMRIDPAGIAHIDVRGVLGDLTPMEKQCGGTDYGDLSADFQAARSEARGVMLTVNSPGGQAANNIETAEQFTGLPSAAFIEGVGASAAYAIAVGADYIVTQPSALVGSIGTILPFVDQSAAWEKAGLKADYIVSGSKKGAGFPPDLSPEQRASLTEIVMDSANLFYDHVLKFRAIDSADMQGQAMVGTRAKDHNLVDATGTFFDAYSNLLARVS